MKTQSVQDIVSDISPESEAASNRVIISARQLERHYRARRKGLFGEIPIVKAVAGVDFDICQGETLALVGESGSGKSTTARLVLQLDEPTEGSLTYRGNNISLLRGAKQAAYRRNVQAVFQDPYSSFNPRLQIGKSVTEPLREAEPDLTKAEIADRLAQALDDVGLPIRYADHYPHQMSGGQRQRAAIARAIITEPQCVVLDEAVSALDVSVRAQVVNLLCDLQERLGMSYMFIAHDLAVVRVVSTHVGVMYLGKIVEIGSAEAIYSNPSHPYTQILMANVLPSHPAEKRRPVLLSGEVPSPLNPPAGCPFHTRCPRVMAACRETPPPSRKIAADHTVACHLHS